MNRRALLLAAGASAVAAGTGAVQADDAGMVDYLFVQTSETAKLSDGVLRLSGATARTLYFSDRPDRIVGHVTTQEFVDHWGTGDDSFRADPPNAVLTVHAGDHEEEIVVVLHEPTLADGDLVYNVEVLSGPETAAGQYASLFIDVIGRPATPLSYAGATRRTSRRTARRVVRRRT